MYPKSFQQLIDALSKLPGVGYKTAQRYAFRILEMQKEELDTLKEGLNNIQTLKHCACCGFLSEEKYCIFCQEKRDDSTIIVVSHIQDVLAIEKIGLYKGRYHILNGNLSSSKGIMPEDLNIDSLLFRINQELKEIILAISPTLDGEMTALYLSKILKNKNIKITRLAHGLPMGSSIDYADDLTIIKAINNRQNINE